MSPQQPLLVRVLLLLAAVVATVAGVGMLRESLVGFIALNGLADAALLAFVNLLCPACLRLGPLRGRVRAGTVASAILLGMAASVAVNLFNAVGPQARVGRFQFAVPPSAVHGVLPQLVLFAAICLVAPLAENAFFFGWPVWLQRRAGGRRWLRHALVGVALALFVLAHGPTTWIAAVFYLVPAILVLAAFWRWGYAVAAVVHGAFNAGGFYLLPLIFSRVRP